MCDPAARPLLNDEKLVICKQVMKIKLPLYTSKDYIVLAIVLLPITLIINSRSFWCCLLFRLGLHFVFPTLITAIAFSIHFTICGAVAVSWKKRFPDESHLLKRLTANDRFILFHFRIVIIFHF